jgi:hypothetical protein
MAGQSDAPRATRSSRRSSGGTGWQPASGKGWRGASVLLGMRPLHAAAVALSARLSARPPGRGDDAQLSQHLVVATPDALSGAVPIASAPRTIDPTARERVLRTVRAGPVTGLIAQVLLLAVRRHQLARTLHTAVGRLGEQPTALRPARRHRPVHAQRRVQPGRVADHQLRAGGRSLLAGRLVVLPLRQALRPP